MPMMVLADGIRRWTEYGFECSKCGYNSMGNYVLESARAAREMRDEHECPVKS